MAKRKRSKRTVRTWEVDSEKPGLTLPNSFDAGIDVILPTEVVSSSAAVRDAGDRVTWRPIVLVDVTGRYNRTSMAAQLRLAIGAAEARSIGEGLIFSADRALEDASAGMVEDGLS